MRQRWRITAAFTAALFAAGPVLGQDTPGTTLYEGSTWTAYVDGGPSWIVGNLNQYVNDGWGFSFGFGPKMGPQSALLLDFMWTGYNLNRTLLDQLKSPDGNAEIFSISLNPLWRFNPHGRVGGYLTAGGGYYHRTVTLSRPGAAVVPVYDNWYSFGYNPYYDPFFGYAVAPADVITGRHNDDTVGANVGLALTFHPGDYVEIFLEARYHYVWTDKRATEFIPLVLGFRW